MRAPLRLLALMILPAVLAACSGEGTNVLDPDSGAGTETALLSVAGPAGGEIVRYVEVRNETNTDDYAANNDDELGAEVDAIYQAFDYLYLHQSSTGSIVVLDLATRKKKGVIDGFPTAANGELTGMAFSNQSQAWVTAYGSGRVFHVDARNHVRVGEVKLPGEPTAIAAVDNRVLIGIEKEDGTGALCMMRSNDPDFNVTVVRDLPEPPIFIGVHSDENYASVILPGKELDDPNTIEFDTDPYYYVVNLGDYGISFEMRFFASNLRDYIGRQPNYADMSNDYYLYLATPEGVIRIDAQSWGVIVDLLPGRSYSVVSADYWSDLTYAVPTDAPQTVTRVTKEEKRLPELSLDRPVSAIEFVSTSRVQ